MAQVGIPLKSAPSSAILAVPALAVSLAAALAGGGALAFALAGTWGLVAFCLSYTKRHDAAPGRPAMARFRYHLCASAVRYLVPVGIATTFYVLLSIYVSLFADSVSNVVRHAARRTSQGLRLRVKVAQAGYAEIAQRTEAELSQRVATALYGKVRDTFPRSYHAALRLPATIDSSAPTSAGTPTKPRLSTA